MTKILVAATFAIALVPAIANATEVRPDDAAIGTHDARLGDQNRGGADGVSTFVTRVLIPSETDGRSVPYADNPELIGNRYGSTNPAWRK